LLVVREVAARFGALKESRGDQFLAVLRLVEQGRTGKSVKVGRELQFTIEYDNLMASRFSGKGADSGQDEQRAGDRAGNRAGDEQKRLKLPGETDFSDRMTIKTEALETGTGAEARSADRADRYGARLDLEKTGQKLYVRNWQKGDAFRPLGLAGTKKLSDLFVDEKVRQAERHETPIVCDEQGRIVWVAGLREDDRFKVTEATRRVISLRLIDKSDISDR
jgi:tRNA(Ile)-lysidine synthetase-like protein